MKLTEEIIKKINAAINDDYLEPKLEVVGAYFCGDYDCTSTCSAACKSGCGDGQCATGCAGGCSGEDGSWLG